MSQLINEIATIDVSDETLRQLNLAGIYKDFVKNYRRLDDLKKFREGYEKDNWLIRWWHNDRLSDAQLDSAEVQAEFSKTLGQLMLVSIMQSKRLAEQQGQLNEQQVKLKVQAEGIADQAAEIKKQHYVLAEQSTKLEKLVNEYFALKGLTEEGAQRLIDIAQEVKSTKNQMLHEFDERTNGVEALCELLTSRVETVFADVNEKLHQSSEKMAAGMAEIRQGTRQMLEDNDIALRQEQQAAKQSAKQELDKLGQGLNEIDSILQTKSNLFETSLASVLEKQKAIEDTLSNFQRETSCSIKRLGYVIAGLSISLIAALCGIVYVLNLF